MIYNLVNYVQTQLSALVIVANGFAPDSPVEAITISQEGGTPGHWYDRNDNAIQILSRSNSTTKAKYNIELVYSLLKNRFGLLLPSVTVDSILYEAIQTYQISPIQVPGYLGNDDENLEMWSYNLMATTK